MNKPLGPKHRGKLVAIGMILLIILSGGAINVPDGIIDFLSKSVI